MTIHIHTPTGTFAVHELVADRLIAAQHVTRDAEGKLSAPDYTILQQQIAELGICDFCSAPEARHIIPVPDFELLQDNQSIGGAWAACDICYELVQTNQRAALLQRAVDHLAYGKFTAASISGLHKKFWNAREDLAEAAGIAAACVDYINDTLPNIKPKETDKDKRRRHIRALTGLADDELDALGRGDMTYKQVSKKLVAWHKKYGTDYDGARRLAELIEQEHKRPLPPGHVPHWQRALDARFEALSNVEKVVAGVDTAPYFEPEAIDLHDPEGVKQLIKRQQLHRTLQFMGLRTDAKFLKLAETYSFNEETTEAIQEAAKSIPHDAPLSSIETPNTGAGWFWFSTPLSIASSPQASPTTAALLWGWESDDLGPVIRFSTFVVDEYGALTRGKVLPATKWYWPLNFSFHEMLVLNRESYRKAYAEGGEFENIGVQSMGEEATIKLIADLSVFFLAACLWFKQKILISAPGHIERHARKRYVRDHKLKEPPSVRVIALRASLREPAPPREPGAEGGKREYHCRWIVKGHARLQVCGPGRKDRKLIWIDPYPKGPEDKPLRTREKVYAVIR